MAAGMEKWQHSMIRQALKQYRKSQDDNYYINNKRMVDVWDGMKAFSLLSPPLGSPAAKRRIRAITRNILDSNTVVKKDGSAIWGSRTPHFLTVAVTYDCQCDCAHCSAYTYRRRLSEEGGALSLDEYKKAIGESIELGTTCVVLSGGEPLVYKGLYDLIESVERDKAITTLFTNGEFLTRENIRKLKASGLFSVFVSIDSTDPTEHDENRRRNGIYERAIAGIRHCVHAGLVTGISTFASREKIQNGELDRIMELAKELEVIEVFLFDMIATGRLIDQRHRMLTPDEVDELRAFQKRYNETTDYPRVIHQSIFTSIAYPCAAAGCPAGVAQVHLRGNGDVAPCDFTPYSFGNVREESMEDIWRRITSSSVYARGNNSCRLADPAYWEGLESETSNIGTRA
jgi:MoaA/NifB/PqqE/SkfB family radical SAM enzyme